MKRNSLERIGLSNGGGTQIDRFKDKFADREGVGVSRTTEELKSASVLGPPKPRRQQKQHLAPEGSVRASQRVAMRRNVRQAGMEMTCKRTNRLSLTSAIPTLKIRFPFISKF